MPEEMSGPDHYERGLRLKNAHTFDAALKEFQEAALVPEQAGKACVQAALCLKAIGRDEEAVTALREALKERSFSAEERLHILYLLGQTLESLHREFEALVVYRMIRRENSDFEDVESRIQELSSGRLLPPPSREMTSQPSEEAVNQRGQLKPPLASLVNQTWQTLAQQSKDTVDTNRRNTNTSPGNRASSSAPTNNRSTPAQNGQIDKRQYGRVAIQLLSQFSSKIVSGSGELRDLSPGGCRITSPRRVPLGATLECWLYPQNEPPFTVEGTVRWIRPREFGLVFTKVLPGVQRRIETICRKAAPLG